MWSYCGALLLHYPKLFFFKVADLTLRDVDLTLPDVDLMLPDADLTLPGADLTDPSGAGLTW